MNRWRKCGAFLAAVLAAAVTVPAAAGPANAETAIQSCTGTWAVTYDPPITNTPRLVTGVLTGTFPVCTDPQAFNASYTQAFTDTVSCTTLLNAGSTSRTYVWGNPSAAPTTFTYNFTTTAVGAQVVVTPNALACAGSGVGSLTGPTTLTIYAP
ncbi:hypothetical protein [Amycolatopsis australiensis]|uniref:Ig-like domain-containing protein n=1 Tax=Amycolatopsis australiensis TaxID=546364 RepID=A0A1K1QGU1_9PSEU|nr:hypothetical protein [Amycolatopsis australiensis]SFW58924.1 hypothetical protein SAMN04489730_1767 [Amycolatopsis australiensis]